MKIQKTKNNSSRGFTLLEMLVVIAIIAIVAAIVIVAINPGRQLAQARNAQRASDIKTIESAIMQYYIDQQRWPIEEQVFPEDWTEICGPDDEGPEDCISLNALLVNGYISDIPKNPKCQNYQMKQEGTRLQFRAPGSREYGLDGVTIGGDPSDIPECDGAVALSGNGGGIGADYYE